jgi:hypothetical protein
MRIYIMLQELVMLDTNHAPDIDALSTWHAALAREAGELRAEICSKQTHLAQVEEKLALVTKLIEVEKRPANGTSARDCAPASATGAVSPEVSWHPNTSDLEDAVEGLLRAAGKPLHISSIREGLLAQRVPIPGRGDDANIIVRLRRVQDRFTRTARGTYSLTEWGIPALAKKSRRRRRRAAR